MPVLPSAPVWTTLAIAGGLNLTTPGGNQGPRYCQDWQGFVHIEGLVAATGAVTASTPLFSNALPAALRPVAVQNFNVEDISGWVWSVNTTGTITVGGALANGYLLALDATFWPGS